MRSLSAASAKEVANIQRTDKSNLPLTSDTVDVQLIHDMLMVGADCFDADAKFVGDLFGRATFGDQLQDFALSGGQPDQR